MIDDSRELKNTLAFHQSTVTVIISRTWHLVQNCVLLGWWPRRPKSGKHGEKSNKNRVGTGARWSNVDCFDYSRDIVVPNVIRTWNRIRRIYDGCFDRRVNLPRCNYTLRSISKGKLTILRTATALVEFFFYSVLINFWIILSACIVMDSV